MELTLICAGVILAVGAVYTLRRAPGSAPALAGENTAVGLADPAADTLTGNNNNTAGSLRTEWHMRTVSGLEEAQELLDRLEVQGFTERELIVLGNSAFVVRWR